ncbi:MAG: hypothetical protein CO108_28765, partial [Deltaproteobacteria bacterium CG_4_9_14_3_um_filter_63_12]
MSDKEQKHLGEPAEPAEDEFDEDQSSSPEEEVDHSHDLHSDDLDLDDGLDDDVDLSTLPPPLMPRRIILMLAVIVLPIWLILGYTDDLAYFFQDDQPIDIGNAMDYVMVLGEGGRVSRTKELDLPHNSYVRVRGLPVHQAAANPEKGRFSIRIGDADSRVIYQLEGAKIFVEEPLAETRITQFKTGAGPSDDNFVEVLDLHGRLLAFADDDAGTYAGIRDYYSARYGMKFCSDMTPAEVDRGRANLGRGGMVLGSSDKGQGFIDFDSGTDASIYAVDFPNQGDVGFAAGSQGTLLRTSDAGNSWTSITTDETASLFGVAFSDDEVTGIAVGQRGLLLRTEDGGRTFSKPYPYVEQDLRAAAFFPGGQVAFAVGAEGLLLKSTDGGKTWSPRPVLSTPSFYDVILRPSGVLLALGEGGLILRSVDTGKTWAPMVTKTSSALKKFVPGPGDTVLAVGGEATVLRSEDDGQTWGHADVRIVPGLEFTHGFEAAAFHADGQRVLFVGKAGALARSTDGGRHLEVRSHTHATGAVASELAAHVPLPIALAEVRASWDLPTLKSVAWAGDVAYAVGMDAAFVVSEDGGRSWRRRTLPLEKDTDLWDILFVDDQIGFIAGSKGLLLTTRDAGQTWTSMDVQSKRTLHDLTLLSRDPATVLFAGREGLWGFWRQSDDKIYVRAPQSESDYYSVAPRIPFDGKINDVELVLAGADATLIAYDDKTETATPLWEVHPAALESVAVAQQGIPDGPTAHGGEHLALAVGRRGAIFRSIDGGFSFQQEGSGEHFDLHAVALSRDGQLAYAAGDNGTLLVDEGANGRWRVVPLGPKRSAATAPPVEGLLPEPTPALVAPAAPETPPTEPTPALVAPAAPETPGPTVPPQDPPAQPPADIPPPPTEAIQALLLTDDETLIVAIGKNLLRSDDHAISFATVYTGQAELTALHAESDGLYAVGANSTLLRSKDQGLTWAPLGVLPAGQSLRALDGLGETLVAVGKAGSIFRSKDNGASWFPIETQVAVDLTGVALSKDGPSWIVGLDGAVLKSDDVGASWIRMPPVSTENLNGLTQRADGQLWIVGADQTFLHSQDGEHWSPRGTLLSGLYDLEFPTEPGQVGYAVGDGGVVLKTTDAGESFSPRHSKTTSTLFGIDFEPTGQDGVAVGALGTLIRTTSFGEVWKKLDVDLDSHLFSALVQPDDKEGVVLIAGEKGAMYRSDSRKLERFSLVPVPLREDIRAMVLADDGKEVIAVGGTYEDPA